MGTLGVWNNVKSSGRRRNVPEAEHLKDKLIRNTEYAGLRKKKGRGEREKPSPSRNVTMQRCPTLMTCRESPHGVYYISPLMTEHILSVYLCHVLAK